MADDQKLLHLMARQMYQSPLVGSATVVQHLTNLLHTILKMEEYEAAVCRQFPQLLIAVLGMIINFLHGKESLIGAEEPLQLLSTIEEQPEAAILDQLLRLETFCYGEGFWPEFLSFIFLCPPCPLCVVFLFACLYALQGFKASIAKSGPNHSRAAGPLLFHCLPRQELKWEEQK